jgi:hypothetical protein
VHERVDNVAVVRRVALVVVAVSVALVGARNGAAAPKPSAMTRPQAARLARALNLTRADMPGFTASKPPSPPSGAPAGGCGPASKRRPLAVAISPIFQDDRSASAAEVHSQVSVLSRASVAAQDVAAWRSRRARRCFAQATKNAFRDFKISRVSVSPLNPHVPRGAGLRLRMSYIRAGQEMTTVIDVRMFARDRAEIILETSSPSHPFASKREDALSALLFARAKKNLP